MLIPILTTTALLLPTVLADFPSDFTPGRCTFDAAVYQDCQGSHINTSLDVSEVYDGAGKHFMEPTDYIDLTDGATLSARVGETNMEIGFEGDSVTFSYNGAQWPGEDDRFTCNIEPWSSERLDCDSEDRLQRVQFFTCAFACGPTAHPSYAAAASNLSYTTAAPIYEPPILSYSIDVPSVDPAGFTGCSASDPLPYEPGRCSFKLQLFNQCAHTPEAGWYSQVLGQMYSLQDNSQNTVSVWSEGVGRIDDRAVRFTGIGELKLAYDTEDKQMYFSFDKPGGWWSTSTKDEGDSYGFCEWGAWTRNELVCDGENEYLRLSDMACVFKC